VIILVTIAMDNESEAFTLIREAVREVEVHPTTVPALTSSPELRACAHVEVWRPESARTVGGEEKRSAVG
jgi:hypothetical protein